MKRGETLAVVAATLVAIGVALGVSAFGEGQDGPVDIIVSATDCREAGSKADGGIQFLPNCPLSVSSPDGSFALELMRSAGRENYIVVAVAAGSDLSSPIRGMDDDMPFTVQWSPRPGWLLVNHYQGSSLQLPRVFELKRGSVVEHDRFLQVAAVKAREISPCLPAYDKRWITGDGLKWSSDGRRLAWIFRTRLDMCVFDDATAGPIPADKQWKPFLMISDVETGAIIEGSIRLLPDDGKWDFPTDGPYADF